MFAKSWMKKCAVLSESITVEIILFKTWCYFSFNWAIFASCNLIYSIWSYLSFVEIKREIIFLIWIHTLLWHWFRFNSWEKLCYVYWMNKTLWERKLLINYTMTSHHWNNKTDTVLNVKDQHRASHMNVR